MVLAVTFVTTLLVSKVTPRYIPGAKIP